MYTKTNLLTQIDSRKVAGATRQLHSLTSRKRLIVCGTKAYGIQHHYGIHPKLINLMQNMYKITQSTIRVGTNITEWFQHNCDSIRFELDSICAIEPALDSIRFEVPMRWLGPDWLQHHSRMKKIQHVHYFSSAQIESSSNRAQIELESQLWQTLDWSASRCILSRDHFNIYLEHIIREAIEGMESNGARVSGRLINNLRFADDIGLTAELLDKTQLVLDKVDQVSSIYGQEISETKTEWMLFSTKYTTSGASIFSVLPWPLTAISQRTSEWEHQLP